MLGAINGNPINLSEINSEGDYPYVAAAVSVAQAGATSTSSGVCAIAAAASLASAAHTLIAAVVNAIKAVLQFIQEAQSLSAAGSVAVDASLDALMADQADQLSALLKMLLRHSAGAAVIKHGAINSIVRHPGGSSLSVH